MVQQWVGHHTCFYKRMRGEEEKRRRGGGEEKRRGGEEEERKRGGEIRGERREVIYFPY